MKFRVIHVSFFCLSFLLSACTSLLPSADQNIKWETRQGHLMFLDSFRVQGALSLRRGKQAEKVSFYFIQDRAHYELSLYGPLGMGRNVIKGDSQSVKLWDAKGKEFTAKSPEILLQQQVGWTLPVSPLQYWIRGLPDKHPASEKTFDVYHHLQQLKQAGWIIDYEKYASVATYDLPTKIRLTRGELQVVVIINTWELI